MEPGNWQRPRAPGAAASTHEAQRDVRWKVVKKLLPGQPGTVKLLRQHGAALVCVRYRMDESGRRRCTTIELMVEQAPTARRNDPTVAVRVRYEETALRAKVLEHGAQWDRTAKLWRMSRRAALALGLKERIVQD